MNEIERLARRVKLRRPPAEWRDRILQYSERQRSASRAPAPSHQRHGWPGRAAWLALAAIWLILGFLSAAHRPVSPNGTPVASHLTRPAELRIPSDLVALLSVP